MKLMFWKLKATQVAKARGLCSSELRSRDDLLAQLKANEELLEAQAVQLQYLDAELKSRDDRMKSKDERLKAKDEQIQCKDAQLEAKDRQLHRLQEACRLQYELRAMQKALGRRNLRDALERAADAMPRTRLEDGVQPRLTKLLKDKRFVAVLREHAARCEVPLDRARDWLKRVYRTACDGIAGPAAEEDEATVHVSAPDPMQRAVVCAIFEHGGIPYRVMEEEENA